MKKTHLLLRPNDPKALVPHYDPAAGWQLIEARQKAQLEYSQTAEAVGGTVPEQTKAELEVDDSGEAVLSVVGPFDSFWGLNVRRLVSDIEDAKPSALRLLIESPGGYAFDGLYFYSALRRMMEAADGERSWGMTLSAEAQGLVASAATLPWVAATDRYMPDSSLLLLHAPWSWLFAVGDEWDLGKAYKESRSALRALRRRMEAIYVARSKMSAKDVSSMIRGGDEWIEPEDALAKGLATRIETPAEEDDDTKAEIDTTDIPPASDRGKALGRWAGLSMGKIPQ